MRLGLRALALVGLLLSGAYSANAEIITIEPDDYAPGTNLTDSVEGVSLQTWSHRYIDGVPVETYSPVYIATDGNCETDPFHCRAATGQNFFSSGALTAIPHAFVGQTSLAGLCFSGAISCLSGGDEWTVLLIEFSQPTSYVQIFGTFNMDSIGLWAFDADHQRLGIGEVDWDYRSTHEYQVGSASITSSSANISYAIVGSGLNTWTILDSLSYERPYTNVPEPATLALFGLGLAGLGFARRRKLN